MAVRITSSQYPGQQCSVVLYSPTGNTIPYTNATSTNLGTKTLPFTYAGDDEYGVFQITINSNEAPCTGFATTPADGDGNKYKIIRINGRAWMSENLKTKRTIDGVLLNNPGNTNPTDGDWAAANGNTTRYWANVGGSSSNDSTYGLLYNQYAVFGTGSQSLCPTGYRIPTDAEFQNLKDYLAVNPGTALKSTSSLWATLSGTNTSGFNGLPAGARSSSGIYPDIIGDFLYLWTSNASTNWLLSHNDNDFIKETIYNSKYGFSVRCIENA